jgi:hypothetical protein
MPLEDTTKTKTLDDGVYSAQAVIKFHQRDDTDSSKTAHHHSLGPSANQAAPGNHNHDGSTSPQLMAGVSITGAKAGNVALANLITALATALGFTDNTT